VLSVYIALKAKKIENSWVRPVSEGCVPDLTGKQFTEHPWIQHLRSIEGYMSEGRKRYGHTKKKFLADCLTGDRQTVKGSLKFFLDVIIGDRKSLFIETPFFTDYVLHKECTSLWLEATELSKELMAKGKIQDDYSVVLEHGHPSGIPTLDQEFYSDLYRSLPSLP